jgi:hypothetical protein
MSKFSSWVLVLAGLFNVVIWPRFAKAIVDDRRSWTGAAWHSAGTGFLWVHVVLIVVAMTFGVAVLVIGARSLVAMRRAD